MLVLQEVGVVLPLLLLLLLLLPGQILLSDQGLCDLDLDLAIYKRDKAVNNFR